MSADRKNVANSVLRKSRRRRSRTAAHVAVACSLAVVVYLLSLLLIPFFNPYVDVSSSGRFELSKRSKTLFESSTGRLEIVAFFEQDHFLYGAVRRLLEAYQRLGSNNENYEVDVTFLDVHRDVVETARFAEQIGGSTKNLIAVGVDGRWQVVSAKELVIEGWEEPRTRRGRRMVFRGEQVLTSAIWSVTRQKRPVVYALQGHGERSMQDYDEVSGCSQAMRLLGHDNINVKSIYLSEETRVPEDADALLLLGPKGALLPYEVGLISDYMSRDGRLLMLVDSQEETGLEGWLEGWGVHIGKRMTNGSRGQRVVVKRYGELLTKRGMTGLISVLMSPHCLNLDGLGDGELNAGQARVWSLIEAETESDYVDPAGVAVGDDSVFAPPLCVLAFAAERGGTEMETGVASERLVVIGDSDFISNSLLGRGYQGNRDLFLWSMNWLLERPELMASDSREESVFQLGLGVEDWRWLGWYIVMGLPTLLLFAGLLVRLKRGGVR